MGLTCIGLVPAASRLSLPLKGGGRFRASVGPRDGAWRAQSAACRHAQGSEFVELARAELTAELPGMAYWRRQMAGLLTMRQLQVYAALCLSLLLACGHGAKANADSDAASVTADAAAQSVVDATSDTTTGDLVVGLGDSTTQSEKDIVSKSDIAAGDAQSTVGDQQGAAGDGEGDSAASCKPEAAATCWTPKGSASCTWTLTGPDGLMASGSCVQASPALDTPGGYKLCVVCGPATCPGVCQSLVVVPSSGINLQLTWSAPTSPTPTDTAGADLDLHFASQLAVKPDVDCDGASDPWFDKVFDCYSLNPSPKWGSSASAANSPDLTLDSTQAPGVETLVLSSPEGTSQNPDYYSIGVHYFDDHGLGPALATVTVVVGNTPVATIGPQLLKPLDLWYVGKLNWPNTLNGGTLSVLQGCWQSGDACLGKQDPSNPQGGQMWQTKGSACITPC